MRRNELRQTLQLRLCGEFERFVDEELAAVLSCWRDQAWFGSWHSVVGSCCSLSGDPANFFKLQLQIQSAFLNNISVRYP
jgi:hypothetical protein